MVLEARLGLFAAAIMDDVSILFAKTQSKRVALRYWAISTAVHKLSSY